MRVFLTGATGFIGMALVPELLQAGHQVIGMTRSDAGAEALTSAGAEVHRGTLEDTDSLRRGAEKAEGVIHCAFDHDFSRFAENAEKDRRAIAAMGSVLKGSDRKLVITSGVALGASAPGQPATEDVADLNHPLPRVASEQAGAALTDAGVKVVVVRLPQVHDTRKQGLITPLIEIFKEKGATAYVGTGQNRWAAAALPDVARLYRLALERGKAGRRYHAVGEEGVPARDIAEVLGRGLRLPVVSVSKEDAPNNFGWMAMFAALDLSASSAWTQEELGWTPTGPGLLADLEGMQYEQA